MTEAEAVREAFRKNPEFAARLRALQDQGKLVSTDQIPDDEVLVIVGGQWPSSIQGSKQVRCGSCNAFLSIAPSTQEMMATRKGKSSIMCFGCVARTEAEAQKAAKVC